MTTAHGSNLTDVADSVPLPGALAGAMAYITLPKEDGRATVLRRGAGLYGLAEKGTISKAHVDAAERWARLYETGIMGASDPERGRSGRRGDIHDMMLARSVAVAKCEGVRRSLGKRAAEMLHLLVIEGFSVSRMAEHYSRGRAQITGAIEIVLEQLVEYFDGNGDTHKMC